MRFLLAIFLLITPVMAYAETATLSDRVDAAGRQRMLTQRIARTMCFVKSEVDVVHNLQKVSQSRRLFSKTLGYFMNGGGKEKFAPEDNMIGQEILKSIEAQWKTFDTLLISILQNTDASPQDLADLSQASNDLLAISNAYVVFLEMSASKETASEILVTRLVNTSGRQRMLAERIGKQACVIGQLGQDNIPQEQLDRYHATLKNFENMTFALAFGSTQLNIPASPTVEISDQNVEHWQIWVSMSADLLAVPSEGLERDRMNELGTSVEDFVASLNATVGYYAALEL